MDIIKRKNTKCLIQDSSLCKWLNKTGCDTCYIMSLSDDEQKEAMQKWEVTQSLLPDDIDELHQSAYCHFCVNEPQKKEYYATIDLANPEPESKKGMFFGFGKKVRSKIGSLLPVSIGCCKKCRRAFLTLDLIKYIVPAGLTVIAILLLIIPAVANAVNRLGELVSILFLAAAFLLGLIISRILASVYLKKKSKDVRFNIFEIPAIAKMREKGWFLIQEQGETPRLIFTKNKFFKTNGLKYKND